MKKHYSVMFAAFLLLLTGCASVTSDIKVDTAMDPKAKLSGYKTYAWLGAMKMLNDPKHLWETPKIDVAGDIKYLIDRNMRKHGIMLSKPEDADLGVTFFVGVDMQAMKLKTDPETRKQLLQNVPGGALVVALIDAETGYVVWVGKATAEIQENASPELVRERLDYAITEMFKKLPRD